ncbi:MAG TPA: hypothetical protein VKY71_03405 [Actinotalea caeni]|uniref:hypothetical protein n=1 Tax=Actinotalea caeni TaxID=1348467 RepID=UPI002B4AE5F5|nr:hypothetical protein [Actinotalea caeni]HLV54605.1 hypothetical protein [Actinotalea caeni]
MSTTTDDAAQGAGDLQGRAAAPSGPPPVPMVEVVEDLLHDVEKARLTLDTPDAEDARARRTRLVLQISNHLLPRLREVSAPAIVVLGGSTGAGKSTLVNSVVSSDVTPAGVLRPTTREPVLVTHPKDAELLADHPVLQIAEPVLHEGTTRGLAILDAPDLDSVHAGNRELADQLVEMADMWVFVTTGSRYGDALPWQRLRDATERGISIAVVLNRVERSGLAQIRNDLFQRLQEQGLTSVPFFVIPDAGPLEGMLPQQQVEAFARFLGVLGAGAQSRSVIARTVRGAWPALREDVQLLAANLDTQRRTMLALHGTAQAATRAAAAQARADVKAGSAATGAPTTAWLAGASSGGPLSSLVGAPKGWLQRRRHRRSAVGRADALQRLRDTSLGELRTLLVDAGASAERSIRAALADTPAGTQLAALVTPEVTTTARNERLDLLFREWRDVVGERTIELTASEPLSGIEISHLVESAAAGVDGASRAVQRLLGDAGTAAAARIRDDLAEWAAAAVAAEADEFLKALDDMDVDPSDAATRLRLRASELREYV